MGQLFSAIVSLAMLLATSAQAATETTMTPMPFKTTSDYIAFCSATTLKKECYAGYEAALVNLTVSKNITNLCAPSQTGAESDEAKYQAAEALEISRYVVWLKAHPKYMSQEFRTGLGSAIVAIYGCK